MKKLVRTKLGIPYEKLKRLTPAIESKEIIKYLKEKLVEESLEVVATTNQKDFYEELGDLLDVIDCFSEFYDFNHLRTKRAVKNFEKGGLRGEDGDFQLLIEDS